MFYVKYDGAIKVCVVVEWKQNEISLVYILGLLTF